MLLELGVVRHLAGQAFDALDAFQAAADISRELDDPQLFARAAIGYEDASWRPGIDRGAVALLEEATAALGEDRPELRVGLLSALARALDMQGQHARGAIVRTNAIALARELDDRAGLANVLVRSYWARGTSPIDDVLEMLTEAKSLGEELGNTEIQAEAMSWRGAALVAIGGIAEGGRGLPGLLGVGEATREPFLLHVARHQRAAAAPSPRRLEEGA